MKCGAPSFQAVKRFRIKGPPQHLPPPSKLVIAIRSHWRIEEAMNTFNLIKKRTGGMLPYVFVEVSQLLDYRLALGGATL